MDFNKWFCEKKIVIFGTGSFASLLLEYLDSNLNIEYCLDNNQSMWGREFNGLTIENPNILLTEDKNNILIIISSIYYDEIGKQLNTYGLTEGVHFINGLLITDFYEPDSKGGIVYPKVINYPITNKCNFRCAMCNVWKPEYSSPKDMSCEDVYQLFKKPLFKEVEHVGISGGEPFVRRDIIEVIKSITNALPKLKSISIITNASLPKLKSKVIEIKEYLNNIGVKFTLQISIDGIGEIHDKNRGFKGAFERVEKNFLELHSKGLVDEISTTITKNNCNELWDIYAFARENDIYIRFRLASLIDRLYNNDLLDNFTFSEIEKLRIIKFLENIIHYYERDFSKKLFYKSLINQLKGGKRIAGCDYQSSKGLSLDPYGNLHFCFPKSRKIRNINNDIQEELILLKENHSVLEEALSHCDTCTHDYTSGVLSTTSISEFFKEMYNQNENYIYNTKLVEEEVDLEIKSKPFKKNIKKIAILGWYGTETLGDKAIIGGIISDLYNKGFKRDSISVLSLNPQYTRLTMKELNEDIEVMDVYEKKMDFDYLKSIDMFIFGGGPLCDVEPLIDMLDIFKKAKQFGKTTVLYSCGIGPLNNRRYIKATNMLLAYSDYIGIRDQLSYNKYKKILPELKNKKVHIGIDPSIMYIQNHLETDRVLTDRSDSDFALFCIREWPEIYTFGMDENEYKEASEIFENKIIELIEETINKGIQPILFPMHNYFNGDDDREYYLKLLDKVDKDMVSKIKIISHDYIPEEAVKLFSSATFVIGMRFHSVVFAVSTHTPCLAFDYDVNTGKVSGFMQEVQLTEYVETIKSAKHLNVKNTIDKLIENKIDWPKLGNVVREKNKLMINYFDFYEGESNNKKYSPYKYK